MTTYTESFQVVFEQFESLVRGRRAVRRFLPHAVDSELLDRLLDCARWAPSGYNLQPTHFIVVTDPELKKKLHPACLNQRQILEAPATVVFTGDRRVYQNNFPATLETDLVAGVVNAQYAGKMRHHVTMAFKQGPLGLGWFSKSLAAKILPLMKATPSIPAVEKKYWLTKQVMLSSMVYMLAATAAGLATVPMEGFDEGRVKRVLGIPKYHMVPVIIPTGYTADEKLKKTRLPLERMVHRDGW